MNITDRVAKEMGVGISIFIKETPEIQIYHNHTIDKYQWRDGRFRDTCDVWENTNYDTTLELKIALTDHLKRKGDIEKESYYK